MKSAIVYLALASLAGILSAQVPLGDEFVVNQGWLGDQRHPCAEADAKGRFVVLWQDQESNEILAMRYTRQAVPRGREIRLSPLTAEEHMTPEVAMSAKGRSVAVWESLESAAGELVWRISAQPLRRNGRTLGRRVQVNEDVAARVSSPDVAMNGKARFVVVWAADGADGDGGGILARRFKKNGRPAGAAFQVNLHAVSEQGDPVAAMDHAGNFVVVWTSAAQDGSGLGIFAQQFRANGSADGGEFRVNTRTRGDQHRPAVAMNRSGAFVVVWESEGQDGSRGGIFGQRFRRNGQPLANEFQVNSETHSDQSAPAVAIDDAGNFVVAWSSWGQDGDRWGVFGQQFGPAGSPIGDEFQLNQFTVDDQGGVVSVAFGRAKEYAATWMTEDQDGDAFGVVARRFDLELAAPPPPPPPPPPPDPKLQFLVDWTPGSSGRNVDIHVREPNNEHIFFGNQVSQTGGELGEQCRCDPDCHEETISWAGDASPQAGTYELWIQLSDLCGGSTNGVTFQLEVWADSELVWITDPTELACDATPVPDCFSEALLFEYPGP